MLDWQGLEAETAFDEHNSIHQLIHLSNKVRHIFEQWSVFGKMLQIPFS